MINTPIAQSVEASGRKPGGCGFESRWGHQIATYWWAIRSAKVPDNLLGNVTEMTDIQPDHPIIKELALIERFVNKLRSGEMIMQEWMVNEKVDYAYFGEVSQPDVHRFLDNLSVGFGLCEMEIGRLAQRVQEQHAMMQPLEERIKQLTGYIDWLIIRSEGPGTYKFGEETWITGDHG